MKQYARAHQLVYLDYYAAMVDERKGLRGEYGTDGVHPNKAGYDVMAPLAEKAMRRRFERSSGPAPLTSPERRPRESRCGRVQES
jgi:hypothetical protein